MKDSLLHTDVEMRNVSTTRKLLSIALTILVVSADRVMNFFYFRKSKSHIFWYWLESCIISVVLAVFLWKTEKLRISSVSKWSCLSLCGTFAIFTAIDGSALNVFHNCSGGSEIHQIGLAVSPVAVIIVLRWTSQKEFGDKLFIAIAICSVLLLVIFCSESDGYVQYYFSLKVAVLGIIFGTALGVFTVILGQLIKHNMMTFSEVLFYINCSCTVLLLPIASFLTGELSQIWSYGIFNTKSFMELLSSIVTMSFLRSLQFAIFFNQISLSSPLVSIATANASWIISSLVITFAFKIELLISTFEAFWVVGLVFVITLCHFFRSTKDSSPNGQLLEH